MNVDASYILPIRLSTPAGVNELAQYLQSLAVTEIIVVDGSAEATFAVIDSVVAGVARHVRPIPRRYGSNGKARGVLTGLALATRSKIVVADDDVRYDAESLRRVVNLLGVADVVRPQNYFDPAPWHAILDGARSLISRSLDGDWPGTLAFRRCALPSGYSADVLFENYELVATIRARGGSELVARDLFVARRPPTVQRYLSQRVRQAYDEFARPVRLAVTLAIAPVLIAALFAGSWTPVWAMAVLAWTAALAGWLRDGAYRHFSILSVLAAPLWLFERAICAWVAVYERLRFGGVRYGDDVIRAAASSPSELRQSAC